MKFLAYFFGGAAAVGAAAYVVIYLYRWQWQRAILCGVLLVIIEVLLFALALLGRMARLEAHVRDHIERQAHAPAGPCTRARPEEHAAYGPGPAARGPEGGPAPYASARPAPPHETARYATDPYAATPAHQAAPCTGPAPGAPGNAPHGDARRPAAVDAPHGAEDDPAHGHGCDHCGSRARGDARTPRGEHAHGGEPAHDAQGSARAQAGERGDGRAYGGGDGGAHRWGDGPDAGPGRDGAGGGPAAGGPWEWVPERSDGDGDGRWGRALGDTDRAAGRARRGAGGGRSPFRWLEEPFDAGTHRTHVFVPVLMITGLVLSGLAWLVQRIAEATVRPGVERRLAGRLAPLAAPPLGAARDQPDLEDLPPLGGPDAARWRRRRRLAVVLGVVGALSLGATLVGLAELTQTRQQRANRAAATSVLVKVVVRGEATPGRADLAARQLWERCRDSTSVPLRRAALTSLGDDLYAGVVHPALADHDRMRLRGCLEDAGVDRTHLTVVGVSEARPDDA
ncbi:hypothetical protein [Streptomyces sp. NPDC057702]|uniref:hypothetical protein n=1 Tax=unclassified Streptomyces TaxID=2593676 RepID=UPI0036C60E08